MRISVLLKIFILRIIDNICVILARFTWSLTFNINSYRIKKGRNRFTFPYLPYDQLYCFLCIVSRLLSRLSNRYLWKKLSYYTFFSNSEIFHFTITLECLTSDCTRPEHFLTCFCTCYLTEISYLFNYTHLRAFECTYILKCLAVLRALTGGHLISCKTCMCWCFN